MAPIIKLTRKTKTFLWTKECKKAWKLIKQKYIEAPITGNGISCSHICILVSYKHASLSSKIARMYDSDVFSGTCYP